MNYDETTGRVTPPSRVHASPGFKERVMRQIAAEHHGGARRRAFSPISATGAAAVLTALVLIISIPLIWIALQMSSGAASLLAASSEAMNRLETMHISARMRTMPGDNFEYIRADLPFVPLEIWKDFRTGQWRVEKPGRVVAMDGSRTVMLMHNSTVSEGSPTAGYVEWLKPLLEPGRIMDHELRAIRFGRVRANLIEGDSAVTLSVFRSARGRFDNDWARNRSIEEADHSCIYRFDRASKRLTGLQVVFNDGNSADTVFEITEIRYNEPLAPGLFRVAIPEGAVRHVRVEEMPAGVRPLPANAKEAATRFFEALAQEDWDLLRTVFPYSTVHPGVRRDYGGCQVVSIGEPFRSGLYPGWYVPYEVRLRNGQTRKWNLAVRNDNEQSRWIQDGGLK